MNKKLKEYIENNVLTEYKKNEEAHGIDHILYVIRRSLEIVEKNKLNVNKDMVYVIAAYHDIAHHIDSKKHEIISAEIMFNDNNLRQFFKEEEMYLMKEAIEDHRASSDHEPRSIYGKIVSTADRNNTVEQCLKRSYLYGKKLDPNASDEELFQRAFNVLNNKFGENGYAKFFFKDEEYEKFLSDIRNILRDQTIFCDTQRNYIYSLKKQGIIK